MYPPGLCCFQFSPYTELQHLFIPPECPVSSSKGRKLSVSSSQGSLLCKDRLVQQLLLPSLSPLPLPLPFPLPLTFLNYSFKLFYFQKSYVILLLLLGVCQQSSALRLFFFLFFVVILPDEGNVRNIKDKGNNQYFHTISSSNLSSLQTYMMTFLVTSSIWPCIQLFLMRHILSLCFSCVYERTLSTF